MDQKTTDFNFYSLPAYLTITFAISVIKTLTFHLIFLSGWRQVCSKDFSTWLDNYYEVLYIFKVGIHVEMPKAAPKKSICYFQKLEIILK